MNDLLDEVARLLLDRDDPAHVDPQLGLVAADQGGEGVLVARPHAGEHDRIVVGHARGSVARIPRPAAVPGAARRSRTAETRPCDELVKRCCKVADAV